MDKFLWTGIIAIILLIIMGIITDGAEHNHPPQDIALHEQFYSTWNRPTSRSDKGERMVSCCNKLDCYPTSIRQRPDGNYEALRREDGKWIMFPATLLEQQQPDPRESPDGQTHVCISAGSPLVYCATLGGGT